MESRGPTEQVRATFLILPGSGEKSGGLKSRARPRKRNPLRKFAGWESGSELPHSKAAQARSTSELTMDLIPPPFTGFPHRRRSAVPAALVLVLLASLFCSTIAWSAQQDSAQLYEGLNVSSIDIIGQPTVNVEELRAPGGAKG